MKKRSASTGNSHQKTTPLFNSLNNLGKDQGFVSLFAKRKRRRERNKIRNPSSSSYPYSDFFSLTWSSMEIRNKVYTGWKQRKIAGFTRKKSFLGRRKTSGSFMLPSLCRKVMGRLYSNYTLLKQKAVTTLTCQSCSRVYLRLRRCTTTSSNNNYGLYI